MKKRVIDSDRFFLVLIIILVLGFSIGFGNQIQSGYAVVDCIDTDEDGYYDEGCSLEDFGCYEVESLIVDSYDKGSLDIDENYFVYISNSGVYSYDLISSSNSLLSDGLTEVSNSRIYGNYVVWQALVGNYWQIYLHDLEQSTTTILNEFASHQISPDVYGNYVVWADNVGGDWDIYLRDLNDGTQSLIISETQNQYSPRIYGDYIVYIDDASGTKDVYLYKISTEEITLIDGSDGDQNSISIYENYVVWQSNSAGNWDIYSYDISTDGIIIVTSESYDEKYPKVSNNLIVWAKYDDNDYDLEYYDFETQDFYSLTDDGVNQILPVVSSSYVVWLDDTNGNYDIFGKTVNPACDSLMFGDCDDSSALISPAGTESCDSLDNDCDGEIDEGCDAASITSTEGDCLIDEISSNVWVESTWNKTINFALDGESVYLVSYGDGSCGTDASDFYLYSAVDDDGTYVTDELVESFIFASIKNYDTYDASYASWNAVYDNDKYYYFISVLNETVVLGDTLLVCEADATCSAESITISDAEDYLKLYSSGCLTDDDCDAGETCVDSNCEESSVIETCEEEWDCSNVEWSECVDGISTLDLSQCQSIPVSDACYTSDYLPTTEKSCSSTTSNQAVEISDSVDEEITNEEVPVFSWINLLLVIGILVGYYAFRK